MHAASTAPNGRISADQLLTLDAVQTELGLGAHAMRMARRRGLRVKYIGRRAFVLGRDLIAFIDQHGKTEK